MRAGVLRVPEEIRILWDHQKNLGRINDIFEIKTVSPLILLENFPDLFLCSLWLHNAAALSKLVNGSSSVTQESGQESDVCHQPVHSLML